MMNMKIIEVTENKKAYLALLLLADEQETMIDRYLERGTMYVLDDGGVKADVVAFIVSQNVSLTQVRTGGRNF